MIACNRQPRPPTLPRALHSANNACDQLNPAQASRRAWLTYTYSSVLSIDVTTTTMSRLAARMRIMRCSACRGVGTENWGSTW